MPLIPRRSASITQDPLRSPVCLSLEIARLICHYSNNLMSREIRGAVNGKPKCLAFCSPVPAVSMKRVPKEQVRDRFLPLSFLRHLLRVCCLESDPSPTIIAGLFLQAACVCASDQPFIDLWLPMSWFSRGF